MRPRMYRKFLECMKLTNKMQLLVETQEVALVAVKHEKKGIVQFNSWICAPSSKLNTQIHSR